MIEFNIPDYVKIVLNKLDTIGEGYLVGGCVRDTILGRDVNDYDITTNLKMNEVKELFKDYHFINKNGEAHSTITIRINGENVEITSFRCSDLEEYTIKNDLLHRDITINAIAYRNGKLYDYFGGINDINNKIIRLVEGENRILEDNLRMLRVLRFSSIFNFNIADDTKIAIHKYHKLINNVSKERINTEINKLLEGDRVKDILFEYKDIFSCIFPKLERMINYDQNNPHHLNDLYTHTVNVVSNTPSDYRLRLAALLHDIGKVDVRSTDELGISHYYKHAEVSYKYSLDILKQLHYSNNDINLISTLIKNHDMILSKRKNKVKRYLNKFGFECFRMLIELKNADNLDHVGGEFIDYTKLISGIDESSCFLLKNLAINGNDIIKLGFNGKCVGIILNDVLDKVIDDFIVNEKEVLLKYVVNKYIK